MYEAVVRAGDSAYAATNTRAEYLQITDNQERVTAVFRRNADVDEILMAAVPYEDFRREYDELWPQGWRLQILSNYLTAQGVRYDAVWRKSVEPEIQLYDVPYGVFRRRYDELWRLGWRLHILTNYVRNNDEVRYTAVWRRSSELEIQLYNASYAAFRRTYDQLWPLGWRLHILNNYTRYTIGQVFSDSDGSVRYTAVWRRSSEPEIQLYDKPYEDFRAMYDELWPLGWRLHIVTNYVVNRARATVRYTGVWRRSTEPEIQLYGWQRDEFRELQETLAEDGWRLHRISSYQRYR
jgi:phosphoglycolate phosphatase-like HAD superfamily hydrolase